VGQFSLIRPFVAHMPDRMERTTPAGSKSIAGRLICSGTLELQRFGCACIKRIRERAVCGVVSGRRFVARLAEAAEVDAPDGLTARGCLVAVDHHVVALDQALVAGALGWHVRPAHRRFQPADGADAFVFRAGGLLGGACACVSTSPNSVGNNGGPRSTVARDVDGVGGHAAARYTMKSQRAQRIMAIRHNYHE
jgi:hypothetical protein